MSVSAAAILPNTTTSTTANAATNAGAGASNTNSQLSLASNFTTFLNLLTTQLQNQDPSNPVDSNQFTQQLVEFAGVQQQVQGNTYLQQILAASQGNAVSSASSYIGTTIQATGDQGALPASGNATFGYTLASSASKVQVTIKDANGSVVFSGSGPGNAGTNNVSWNGTNSVTGVTEPAGVYTMSVTAADANGTAITATPFITGTVQSASISNGVVNLSLGSGLEVPTTNVTSITNLPGSSSGSGLASEISGLGSEISSLSSEISSLL
jgi:flagellar basal-body rod modification protein FlgD